MSSDCGGVLLFCGLSCSGRFLCGRSCSITSGMEVGVVADVRFAVFGALVQVVSVRGMSCFSVRLRRSIR
jgi:hypothetical protein